MVIAEEDTVGKEQLKTAPKKRQLLDSDEEQEDEGRNRGRELDGPSFSSLILKTNSTTSLPLNIFRYSLSFSPLLFPQHQSWQLQESKRRNDFRLRMMRMTEELRSLGVEIDTFLDGTFKSRVGRVIQDPDTPLTGQSSTILALPRI